MRVWALRQESAPALDQPAKNPAKRTSEHSAQKRICVDCPTRHLRGVRLMWAQLRTPPLGRGRSPRLGARAGTAPLSRHYSKMQFDFLVGR
jgi:hypothetical protein